MNQNNQCRTVYTVAELYSPEPRKCRAKTSKNIFTYYAHQGDGLTRYLGCLSILTMAGTTGAAGVVFEEVPLGFPFGMMKTELSIQNNPKFK